MPSAMRYAPRRRRDHRRLRRRSGFSGRSSRPHRRATRRRTACPSAANSRRHSPRPRPGRRRRRASRGPLRALEPHLAWAVRNTAAQVGEPFLSGHANATIVGQGALEPPLGRVGGRQPDGAQHHLSLSRSSARGGLHLLVSGRLAAERRPVGDARHRRHHLQSARHPSRHARAPMRRFSRRGVCGWGEVAEFGWQRRGGSIC